jgi:3-oxoacyl-[acyl-carrier protein] reductase
MNGMEDTQRLAGTALERFGTINILANVAGIYPAALVTEMTEEEWDRVYDVNVSGGCVMD